MTLGMMKHPICAYDFRLPGFGSKRKLAWKEAKPHSEDPDMIVSSSFIEVNLNNRIPEPKRSESYSKTLVVDFKVS